LQQLHNAEKYGKESFKGVSILDAVLAEIIVRWFCPSNGKTFDCFAGDTVFGFVSGYIGHEFTGIELREEQARLNNARVQEANLKAKYICDDGQNVQKHLEVKSQDMFFSCPPYFDLEEYSDLPNDASNQKSYEGFINILKTAFTGAMNCLKDDRFAIVVMSNVRAKDGAYYDICGDITRIMQGCGLVLYNDIVLLNSIGTVAIRAGRFFNSGRKVGRCHQQVLVYYKGNIKNIKSNFEPLDFSSLETTNESI
jgi:DNA modification methylase